MSSVRHPVPSLSTHPMNVEVDGTLIPIPLAIEAAGADAIDAYVAVQAAELGLVWPPAPAPAPSSPPQE